MPRQSRGLRVGLLLVAWFEVAGALDRDAIAACFPRWERLALATVRTRDGRFEYPMAVHAQNDVVSSELLRSHTWEIDAPAAMGEGAGVRIPPSGTFLDIGGNLGYYSLLFAKYGWRVITVEPMPHNVAAINASLCLNPDIRHRITLVNTALSSRTTGMCGIRSRGDRNVGNGILLCPVDCSTHGRQIRHHNLKCADTVPLTTLDRVLAALRPASIDVVKVDIEGSECDMLTGARSLFRGGEGGYRPLAVQIESGRRGENARCLDKLVANASRECERRAYGGPGAAEGVGVPPAAAERAGAAHPRQQPCGTYASGRAGTSSPGSDHFVFLRMPAAA